MDNQLPDDEFTADDVRREREAIEERLQAFGNSIAKKRDEAVSARRSSGIEKRWIEDADHYNGIDPLLKASASLVDTAIQNAMGGARKSKQIQHRSKVFVNLTRPRTNVAEARIADMLLPSDDRNWGIKPVSAPELNDAIIDMTPITDQSGQRISINDGGMQRQATVADHAHSIMDKANKSCAGMQDEIDRQLSECDYNGEVRKVIHDSATLGTGILKGPIVVSRTKKSWTPMQAQGQTVHVLEIKQDLNPASNRVDPWNFFADPSCGDDIHNGSYCLERRYITKRQLRDLAKIPGYLGSQIKKVLEEGPKHSALYDDHDAHNRDQSGFTASKDSRYELWEYYGEIDIDDMQAAGVDVSEDDNPLQTVEGCIVVINNTVIKASPNPLETGGFPYDIFVWEKVEGHWAGYGVPYLLRTAQRVLNAGWRQIMDNAGLSVGPQIVVKRGTIDPADGNWEITGRKIWFASDDTENVRDAFTLFEISSHLQELERIIELALKFIDEESMVPQIAQGEKDGTPDTLGGMTILMNSANIVLRRIVKQFDDMITRPHLRRYYDYNMQFNPNPAIKGDFEVDARGSSALVVRDTQNEAFVQSLQLGGSPVYGHMIKTADLLRKALSARSIDPDDIVKDDQEIAKIEQQQAQSQGAQKASPDAQIRAQSAENIAKIREQGEQVRAQTESEKSKEEIQFRAQQHQADRDYRIQELMIQRDIEVMKLSSQSKMSLDEIKAKLADTAIKERTKKEIFAAGKTHDAIVNQTQQHTVGQ